MNYTAEAGGESSAQALAVQLFVIARTVASETRWKGSTDPALDSNADVQLGSTRSFTFQAFDFEGLPVAHSLPNSGDLRTFMARATWTGTNNLTDSATPLEAAQEETDMPVVYNGGGRYSLELTLGSTVRLGTWDLQLTLTGAERGAELAGPPLQLLVECPPLQSPLPSGAGCGCVPGLHVASGGQDCEPCAPGTEKPDVVGICEPCSPGYAQPLLGRPLCSACEEGKYAQTGQQTCNDCPDRTWSVAGSSMCSICAAGFYLSGPDVSASAGNCITCPDEAVCGVGTALNTLLLVPNHWRLSVWSTDIRRCPEEGGVEDSACLGGGGQGADSRRLASDEYEQSGSLYCRNGMSGPRCEECVADDEFFDQDLQRCEQCPGAGRAAGILIGLVCVVVAVLALCYWAWRRAAHSTSPVVRDWRNRISIFVVTIGIGAKFKILLGFFRATTADRTWDLHSRARSCLLALPILLTAALGLPECWIALVYVYGVTLPSELTGWLNSFSWMSLNLDLAVPAACIGNAQTYLMMSALWPIVAILACAAVFIVHALVVAHCKRKPDADNEPSVSRSLTLALTQPTDGPLASALRRSLIASIFITFCVLPPTSRDILNTWACESFGASYDGASTSFMRTHPDVDCGSEEHGRLEGVSWAFLVFWPICMPLARRATQTKPRRATSHLISSHSTLLSPGLPVDAAPVPRGRCEAPADGLVHSDAIFVERVPRGLLLVGADRNAPEASPKRDSNQQSPALDLRTALTEFESGSHHHGLHRAD